MKLHAATQEGLLGVLCYEDQAGALAASMMRANDFDPVYKEIAELAIDYHTRFKMAPGEHTVDLFNTATERNESRAPLFEKLLGSVETTALSDNFNADYMLERASTFVRFQRLKGGMEGALRDLTRGTEESLNAAESKLTLAMAQTELAFDPGVAFLDDMEATMRFLDNPEEAFPTGIPELDRRGLGPSRGRLHMLMADTNKGKSWWLIHLAACARKYGLNVLYVGLEMGESEINGRLVQRMLSVTKRQGQAVDFQRFIDSEDPDDAGMRMKTVRMAERPSFQDKHIGRDLRKKLRKYVGQGRTIVKEFPQGTLSVEGYDNYLTILESRESFIPDIVLVDYADLMQPPSGLDNHEGLTKIAEGLRRVAQQRHHAVATVTQVNAEGAKSKRVDVGGMAGARKKAATADTLLTYSQTDEEHKRGLARLFPAKVRNEEGRFTVMISQAYAVGQFVLDSVRLGENTMIEEAGGKRGDS